MLQILIFTMIFGPLNITYIRMFYFKQISRYFNVINAKTIIDFQSPFISYCGIQTLKNIIANGKPN